MKRRLGAFFCGPQAATITIHLVGVALHMIATKMKPLLYLLGFTSILLSANAQSIALGQIYLDSTVLQPLKLHVELTEVEGILPGSMVASMAGKAQFRAAGLTYQDWYSELEINIVNDAGNYLVQVTGQQPVEQSQLSFIFEVDHLGDRLLAEYAIKLPSFVAPQQVAEKAEQEQGPLKPINLSVSASGVLVQAIEAEIVVEEALVQLVASKTVAITKDPVLQAPVWVVVKPGQNLWRIAVNNSPKGISPWQTLISLYRGNPTAYRNGDIRQVMANSKLLLPTLNELNSLTAKQAKAAYDVLVPAPVELAQKKLTKNQPKALKVEQENVKGVEQQVQNQQNKLNSLASQSQILQAEVEGLQVNHTLALSQQELLAKTSENLAQGLAVQQQDIKSLSQQKDQIEASMLALDIKFETKQADLNQTEQDLAQAKQALAKTETTIASVVQANDVNEKSVQTSQWRSIVQVLGFLLLPVLFIAGIIWWIISRGRRGFPERRIHSKVIEEQPTAHQPVADYATNLGTQTDNMDQGVKKVRGGMPERSFIEELLQQQEQDETQAMDEGLNPKIQDDQLHLSADVEAMLTGQKLMHNQADEPVDYLSHDEEMNTKLDLALSYRDMGDLQKAQAMLRQVLNQGDAEQQAKASALLSNINEV